MSWAAAFWIVYGVGSTLFVIYLFWVGKNVASNRKELIERELKLMRGDEAPASSFVASVPAGDAESDTSRDPASRLRVQRIFQPDESHLAVQGTRNGATCVINLPIAETGVAEAETREQWSTEPAPVSCADTELDSRVRHFV